MIAEAPAYGTSEWVEWRRNGLGASELPAILGLDPYRTEHELWQLKTGRVAAFAGNPKTRWGHRLEALGLDVWQDANRTGAHALPNTAPHNAPEWPHLWATPDALGVGIGTERPVGIEVKVTSAWQQPPERVRVQCLVQAALADLERVDVVRLSFDSDPTIFRVERDEAAIADILAAGEAWYVRHVIEGIEPPLQEGERPADERQTALAADLRRVRKAMAQLERQESAIRDDLIASVAGQGIIAGTGWRIDVTRARAATRTDWKDVAAEYRAALDHFAVAGLDLVVEAHQSTGRPTTRLTARWDEEE